MFPNVPRSIKKKTRLGPPPCDSVAFCTFYVQSSSQDMVEQWWVCNPCFPKSPQQTLSSMRAEAGPVLYASVSSRASTWSDPTTSLLNKEMRSGQEEGAYRVMGQGCCPKGEQGGQTGLPSPRASSELSDPLGAQPLLYKIRLKSCSK